MELEHVFVYGTLKTGQCREDNWPIRPLQIRRAWTRGRLYDTGPFPALTRGEELAGSRTDDQLDCVAGQLWTFPLAHVPRTLEILDQIEGTNQTGFENEYDRRVVDVILTDGTAVAASLYVFARLELLPEFRYIPPRPLAERLSADPAELSIWPDDAPWSA